MSTRVRKTSEYSIKNFQETFLCYFHDVKDLLKTNDEYDLKDLTTYGHITWSFYTTNISQKSSIIIGKSSRKNEDMKTITNELADTEIFETLEFQKIHDCWFMIVINRIPKWWYVHIFDGKTTYLENFNQMELIPRVRNQEYIRENVNVCSEIDKVINQIYSNTNIEREKRMQFMSLIWVMLHRDKFKYAEFDWNGKHYELNLKEYLDWIDEISKMDRKSERFRETEKICDLHSGKYFFEACKRLYQLKTFENMKNIDDGDMNEEPKHGTKLNKLRAYMKSKEVEKNKKFVEDIYKKQLKYLEGLIDSFNETNVKNNVLVFVGMVYDRIYKPFGEDYDFLKAVFDGESKYFKGAADGSVKRGQVFTHMIVKHLLMYLFKKNIIEDGKKRSISMMDPTCGTGGFAHAFMNYVERWNKGEGREVRLNVYENELESALANIAFLEGFTSEFNVLTFNFDIFDQRLKNYIQEQSVDYVFMNPPYAMGKAKDIAKGFDSDFKWIGEERCVGQIKKNEMTFCRYSVENYGRIGCWFAWLIPVNKVSENKANWDDKEQILLKYELWYVITMNKDLFKSGKSSAAISTVLLIGRFMGARSEKERTTWKTRLVDLSNDEGVVKRGEGLVYEDLNKFDELVKELLVKGKSLDGISGGKIEEGIRICVELNEEVVGEEFKDLWKEEVLTKEKSWIMRKEVKLTKGQLRRDYLKFSVQRLKEFMDRRLRECLEREEMEGEDIDDSIEWRTVKVGDLFDIVKSPSYSTAICCEGGKYPLISKTSNNEGICGYCDKLSYDATDEPVLTCEPISGTCFIQKGKFAKGPNVMILKLNDDHKRYLSNIENLRMTLSSSFKNVCSYDSMLNCTTLPNVEIDLPFNKTTNELEFKTVEWRDIPFADIFESLGRGKTSANETVEDGTIPLISATRKNNGICGYVSNDSRIFGTTNSELFSISVNGDCGFVSFHVGQLAAVSDVMVFKMKDEWRSECFDSKDVAAFCSTLTTQFADYDWTNKLSMSKFNATVLSLPFNVSTNKLDFSDDSIYTPPIGFITLKDISISELFEDIITSGDTNIQRLGHGDIPFLSCTFINNGIQGYVNAFNYDSKNHPFLFCDLVNGNFFVHQGKVFVKSRNIGGGFITKLKGEYQYLEPSLKGLSFYMSFIAKQVHDYSYKLTKERFYSMKIPNIPFVKQGDDRERIDVEALLYSYI